MRAHAWSTPRAAAGGIKYCMRCDLTYADFLGTDQPGCAKQGEPIPQPLPMPVVRTPKPKPRDVRPRPQLLDDEPAGAVVGKMVFTKPKLPHVPERRGCKGLYCVTRLPHIHSGTHITYL